MCYSTLGKGIIHTLKYQSFWVVSIFTKQTKIWLQKLAIVEPVQLWRSEKAFAHVLSREQNDDDVPVLLRYICCFLVFSCPSSVNQVWHHSPPY